MVIIGEKINGAIPSVAVAIKNRDSTYIKNLAQLQEEAGADYLDVCAGTSPEEEYDALCWLIETVQSATEKPLCLDSPNPKVLAKVFSKVNKPGILNSISGESDKCEVLLPLIQENTWQVVALCCDNSGIAAVTDDKVKIAFGLIEKAAEYGVAPDRIHIDPLVLALSAVNDAVLSFNEAIRRIKEKYTTVNITAALSNVSFGMPARKLVNQNFLTLALAAGLDSVIADPTSRDIIGTIFATESLLGRDRYCRNFNKAFRAGKIGPVKK